jgi:hypothetical protein
LALGLIRTPYPPPLDLKAFRQGKLASAVARGCFQRSPEAVTFGQEAEKNTIIDVGCFPTEGLEIHCPSFLLLRCLCFHISRFLSYRTFFLFVFSFMFFFLLFFLSPYVSFLTLLASFLLAFLTVFVFCVPALLSKNEINSKSEKARTLSSR